MREALTAAQYRALKFMLRANGIVTVEDPEIVRQIHDLISTKFAAVEVTVDGIQAVRKYERENADLSARTRIAAGMSAASRSPQSQDTQGGDNG